MRSYGVQTSPFQFVTTSVAPLNESPAGAGTTYIEVGAPLAACFDEMR